MEEIAFELAGAALQLAGRPRRRECRGAPHGRMTEVLRYMAEHSAAPHKLAGLARMARMSPYHFLRGFKATTGVTPHQWLLRARLRKAAEQLATTSLPVTECGARRRLRRPVEFHPQVPRRIRRVAAGIPAGGVSAKPSEDGSAIFSKFPHPPLPYLSPIKRMGDSHAQPCIDRRARHRTHQALL